MNKKIWGHSGLNRLFRLSHQKCLKLQLLKLCYHCYLINISQVEKLNFWLADERVSLVWLKPLKDKKHVWGQQSETAGHQPIKGQDSDAWAQTGSQEKNTGQDRQTFNGDVWLKQSKRSCRFTSLHDKVSHFQEPWCVFSLTINQLQTQVKGHM